MNHVGEGSPMKRFACILIWLAAMCLAARAQQYDVIIRNGTVYDGSGGAPWVADVAINGDRVARIGGLGKARGKTEVNAKGLAVAPGFINMMSSEDSLMADGRSQSDIRQGVTLEIFGEGESMGPVTPAMRDYFQKLQGDIKYPIDWSTLGEGLDRLAQHGISCNVASFVGAATIRENVLGFANRAPTAQELDRMRSLMEQAMHEGALGVASALIYAPGAYAKTDELIALAGRRQVSRDLHFAHAQRRQSTAGSGGRVDRHRPHRARARGDLSPQSCRERELEQAGRRDQESGDRASQGPAHYRRHVHLHGRRHRPRCLDAALGAGGRL